MQEAILITDSSFELADFKLYTINSFDFKQADEKQIEHFIALQDDSYFSISKSDTIFGMLEPDEQQIIKSEFQLANVFLCLFYNFKLFQELILSFPDERNLMIYNDHDNLMKRAEFFTFKSYEEFIQWK